MPKRQRPSDGGAKQRQTRELIDALYSDGSMSRDDREELLQWLADRQNSEIKLSALLDRYRKTVKHQETSSLGAQMWPELARRLGIGYDPFADKAAVASHKVQAVRIPLHKRWIFRAAAILMPLLFVGIMMGLLLKQADETPEPILASLITVSSAEHETMTVTLPDNSVVALKPNTTIQYPENFTENRDVALNGEAYFEVAKMNGAPFTVKTENLNVTVTGTEFALRDYAQEDRAEITLVTGSVNVEADKKNYSLTPSEKLTIEKTTGDVYVEPDDKYHDAGKWRKAMSFDGATLKEVFDFMAKQYDMIFKIEGGQLPQDGIRIDFASHVKLDEALGVLSRTNKNFTYEIAGDTVYIHPKAIMTQK